MLVKLDTIAKIITGGTPSTNNRTYWDGGNIPWLQSGCCQNCYVEKAEKYITQSGYDNSSARLMPKDTIMIALTGATAGKIGYLNFEACGNQSITGITPNKEKILPKYLYYFLIHRREKTLLDCIGGAQPHISQNYVKNIEITLRHIDEQQKIISILDSISFLIDYSEKQLLLLGELIKSRFVGQEVCSCY